ncbi:MAG: EAL domain-containing protein [Mycobacteriales bacterium]
MPSVATAQDGARAVLDALRAPVLLLDGRCLVTAANGAAGELLQREVSGQPVEEVLVSPDALRGARRAVAEGASSSCTAEALLPDGSRRAVALHIAPLRLSGEVDGAVVTVERLAGGEPASDAASEAASGTGSGATAAAGSGATADAARGSAAAATTPSRSGSAAVPAPAEVELAEELRQALNGDEIVLHYQPIVRLHDRRPMAAEALVRWDHPRRGLLRPVDFLDTADSAELAGPLAACVLRQAAHTATTWSRTLRSTPPIQIAVNLSERQLLQPDIAALVREALTVADCPAERMLIEVAEGALLQDPEAAGAALRAMKELGVEIAVDDLGTGSSALSYLKRFPIDLVKVDRWLVAGLGTDPEQSAVVAALVSLAQAIGVRCVAEGVETSDQLDVLRRLGCELGQGYLFSRAMNVNAATDWLARAVSPRETSARARSAVEPATVQRILDLQSDGASLHTIAARINAEGHRNTDGRRWHHTSVAQLIAGHRFPGMNV